MFYLGVDVSLKSHRCALLDAEGERVQKSFSIDASQEGFCLLLATLEKEVFPKKISPSAWRPQAICGRTSWPIWNRRASRSSS